MSEKAAVAKQEADLVALKLQDARTELSTAQRDRDGQYVFSCIFVVDCVLILPQHVYCYAYTGF